MNDPTPNAPSRRRGNGVTWILLLVLLAAAAWYGWSWWQTRNADAQAAAAAHASDAQRLDALELRVDGLRRNQHAQAQRLQQAEATNRLLREELLGIGQRAALLEDSLSTLADPERHGAQALQLDQVELLLVMAQERLTLSGDLEGARRACAQAAGLLDGIDDPAWLNLHQTLAQECAALDAAVDPGAAVAVRLDALAAALATLPERPVTAAAADAPEQSWLERLLSRAVQVSPSDRAGLTAPDRRAGGLAAMQIEFALARAALARRDSAGFHAALARIDDWLTRLWPESQAREQHRQTLRELRQAPLTLSLPVLGSSLQQLRAMRSTP